MAHLPIGQLMVNLCRKFGGQWCIDVHQAWYIATILSFSTLEHSYDMVCVVSNMQGLNTTYDWKAPVSGWLYECMGSIKL